MYLEGCDDADLFVTEVRGACRHVGGESTSARRGSVGEMRKVQRGVSAVINTARKKVVMEKWKKFGGFSILNLFEAGCGCQAGEEDTTCLVPIRSALSLLQPALVLTPHSYSLRGPEQTFTDSQSTRLQATL